MSCRHCGVAEGELHLGGCPEVAYVEEIARREREQAELMWAQGQRNSHTIETGTAYNSYAYRCSCGWAVDHAWIRDVAKSEISGMLAAHCAGGAVGPTQKRKMPRVPYDVRCYNCDNQPHISLYLKPLIYVCCDGELQMKPRRRFNFEA